MHEITKNRKQKKIDEIINIPPSFDTDCALRNCIQKLQNRDLPKKELSRIANALEVWCFVNEIEIKDVLQR